MLTSFTCECLVQVARFGVCVFAPNTKLSFGTSIPIFMSVTCRSPHNKRLRVAQKRKRIPSSSSSSSSKKNFQKRRRSFRNGFGMLFHIFDSIFIFLFSPSFNTVSLSAFPTQPHWSCEIRGKMKSKKLFVHVEFRVIRSRRSRNKKKNKKRQSTHVDLREIINKLLRH